MTRIDFNAIAQAIKDGQWVNCDTVEQVRVMRASLGKVARQIADYAATRNPRFNREKFLAACGVE